MWKYLKVAGNSRTYEWNSCFIYIFNCLMFLWLRLQWSFICCSQQYLLSMKARTLLMGPAKGSRTINKTIVKRIWRSTAACGRRGMARHGSLCRGLTEQWRWLGAWSIETSKITMQMIIIYNDMNTLVIQIIMCLEKYWIFRLNAALMSVINFTVLRSVCF